MTEIHKHITLKTANNSFKEAERKLKVIFKKISVSESDMHNLLVASSEAVNNAVQHGNKHDPAKNILIDVDYVGNELTVSIQDEGGGFDPTNLPDPLLPENLLKPSGRGIHIMKSLMDNVSYNFTPRGTKIIMKLRVHKDS